MKNTLVGSKGAMRFGKFRAKVDEQI